jgi:hypothetical protein
MPGAHRAIIGFPLVFRAEFLELCPHRRQPALQDPDDLLANLGRRKGGSVYQPTPTTYFILCADDHLIGIAIHGDEALGLLDLLHQIRDGNGLVSSDGLGIEPLRQSMTGAEFWANVSDPFIGDPRLIVHPDREAGNGSPAEDSREAK